MPAVLLVDDEPDIIAILEMVLREEDMDVYTSRSAREALDVLRDRTVDVVVSDIRMPDLTGVELLRQAALAGDRLCDDDRLCQHRDGD